MPIEIQRTFLDILPLWGVFLLTIAICLLALEGGFRFGRRWKIRHPDESESEINTLLGATLGLWAFLLAFMVNIATGRFDERRALVLQEANSIGTTYLRAGYLPEPYAAESRKLLQEYVASRVAINTTDGFREATHLAGDFHVRLWRLAQDVAATAAPNPVISIYISSLNETIDLHTSRVKSLTTDRVPYTIYLSMYFIGALAMFMLGFHSGLSGKRHLVVALTLILVFSSIMLLVIDLDRPWGGILVVSQQPMLDLVNSLPAYK